MDQNFLKGTSKKNEAPFKLIDSVKDKKKKNIPSHEVIEALDNSFSLAKTNRKLDYSENSKPTTLDETNKSVQIAHKKVIKVVVA